MTIAITLAGGAYVFAAFLMIFLGACIYGLYTTRGSGIGQHPYGNIYSSAPAARGPSQVSGRDLSEHPRNWSHGTR
jgi:hypothetical protein